MSHRSTCPDPWEARREGERAGHRGYGSNPYDDYPWNRERCDEAADEWKRGYRAGEERREEEEREERAAARRAQERREEEAYHEAAQLEYERQQYYAMQEESERES